MKIPLTVIEHYLARAGYNLISRTSEPSHLIRFATLNIASKPSSKMLSVYGPDDADKTASLAYALQCVPIGSTTGDIPARHISIETDESLQEVCDKLNVYISELAEWDVSMMRTVFRKSSCQDLLESSEPFLGMYVGLSDALYAHVAHTSGIEPIEDMSRSLVNNGRYPDYMMKVIEHTAAEQKWSKQTGTVLNPHGSPINPFPAMNRIFTLNGHYAAHLVAVSPNSISEGELFIFDMLAEKVGLKLQKFWDEDGAITGGGAEFLRALLQGDLQDQERLAAQAYRQKIPLEGLFALYVIDGAGERGGLDHFAKRIRDKVNRSVVTIIDSKIYILLQSDGTSGELSSGEQFLVDMTLSLSAQMGASSKFSLLSHGFVARKEADIALEFGRKHAPKYASLLPEDPELFSVYRFKRYFPCFVADPDADTREFLELFRNSDHPVSRILKDDERNGTHDYNLLRVYLFYDCNIKQTAARLNMHRNTVSYRISRIESEYRIDLSDSDTRLFLHFVFAVMD